MFLLFSLAVHDPLTLLRVEVLFLEIVVGFLVVDIKEGFLRIGCLVWSGIFAPIFAVGVRLAAMRGHLVRPHYVQEREAILGLVKVPRAQGSMMGSFGPALAELLHAAEDVRRALGLLSVRLLLLIPLHSGLRMLFITDLVVVC